jgi:hypothetical protein
MSSLIKILEKCKNQVLDWILLIFLLFFITTSSYNHWKDNDQLPVVTQMQPIEDFKYDSKKGIWFAEIEGVKQRNCVFIPSKTLGMVKTNGKWQQVEFFFTNDSTPGQSRPTGFQQFDTWNWVTPFDTQELKVLVKHVCNDVIVVSTIGPFKLK